MAGQHSHRFFLSLTLLVGVFGCAVTSPTGASDAPLTETKLSGQLAKFKESNAGRIVGTLSATAEELKLAGAASVTEAVVRAYDPDPARTPLSDEIKVDANGNFVLTNLKESRPRIFVEAVLGNVRYSAFASAPRARKDVAVTLDAPSTYLADKLRVSALDKEVPLDRLDGIKVNQTAEVVNTYMLDEDRQKVVTLQQDSSLSTQERIELTTKLNAYAFDHFMDDHEPVKKAVYNLGAGMLRGWKPTPAPKPTPTPRVTPRPIATPTPTPTPEVVK